jgi:hypothetical protein
MWRHPMGGNKDKRKKRCSKSLPETSTDLFSVRIWHYKAYLEFLKMMIIYTTILDESTRNQIYESKKPVDPLTLLWKAESELET